MADGAGAAGDQNGLSGDWPVGEHGAPRGHARDAEGCAGGKGNVVGQRRHKIVRQRDIFRRGAEGAAVALAVEQPDTVADGEPRHAFADLVDDARAVAVRDHAWKLYRAITAAAPADIGRIDARRFQPHEHLAQACHGRRHLAKAQDLGRGSSAFVPDRSHRRRQSMFRKSMPSGNDPTGGHRFSEKIMRKQ